MRSLLVFVDMLGGEYVSLCNKEAEPLEIENLFKELGGVVYQECYTPAPDTGRSSACMWTGCYPKRNGCDHRLKYPRYFLNESIDNIWGQLKENNYDVNIFSCDDVITDGLVPLDSSYKIFNDVHDFFDGVVIESNNSMNFFYLPDVHTVFNVMGYTVDAFRDGVNELLDVMRMIFDNYEVKKDFDYIIIFSDHGFRLWNEDCHRILDRDRTHTYMQLWRKGDSGVKYDRKLRSNLDIFPTICELEKWGINGEIDGISLNDVDGHDYLMMEDHEDFYLRVGQTISTWGIITSDGEHHWLDARGKWEHENGGREFSENNFMKSISERMSFYSEYSKLFKYSSLYLSHVGQYKRNSKGDMLSKKHVLVNLGVLEGKKIVLYGAGFLGKEYYFQLQCSDKITILAWIDINYKYLNEKKYPMELNGINWILKNDFDFVVIAILDKKTVDYVCLMLEQMGVSREKILATPPKEVLEKVTITTK